MIALSAYKSLLELLATKTGIENVMAVTVDEEMGSRLGRVNRDQTTLFYLPPLGEAEGRNGDAYRENNQCVVFVMKKYDPQRVETISVVEQVQGYAEQLKNELIAYCYSSCVNFRLDIGSVSMMAETQFYRGFAGWSVSFSLLS